MMESINTEISTFSKSEIYNLDRNLIYLPPILEAISKNNASPKEYAFYRAKYDPERLKDGQRMIYNYILKNPYDIITIQGGLVTGRTFTLSSITYTSNWPTNVIIYSHDLLNGFRLSSNTFTVAKLIMNMLNLDYSSYRQLMSEFDRNLTSMQFMISIINLLRRGISMPPFKNAVVILDEYTMIEKPMLLIMLMLLEYHKIGTVICGDKNQFENIDNSKHAICSSYTIAKCFSKRVFTLDRNELCANATYNTFIDYIRQYSSDMKLDDFAFAIVTVMFHKQLLTSGNYHDTHLAGRHAELTEMAHNFVRENKYDFSFYCIDYGSHEFRFPSEVEHSKRYGIVGKFLPYLPLVIGARYYVHKRSEYSQAVLTSIDLTNNILKLVKDDGVTISVEKESTNDVVFEQHVSYLLDNCGGELYNFPIYPANFMSFHKCQGCTISNKLDISLHNTNYRGLYVALSRVTDPDQITRIMIKNPFEHLTSAIINFPELIQNEPITVDILKERMINYKFYKVTEYRLFYELIVKFLLSTSVDEKHTLRQDIIDNASKYRVATLNPPASQHKPLPQSRNNDGDDEVDNDDYDPNSTMIKILKYRNIFLALSRIEHEIDQNIWLHEFVLCNPYMYELQNQEPTTSSSLLGLLDNAFNIDIPSVEYIKQHAKLNKPNSKTPQYIIETVEPELVKETTKFCFEVYKMYENKQEITGEWLMSHLKEMLNNGNATKTRELVQSDQSLMDL